MQDPEIYLNELGLELTCAVDPSRSAVIDSLHRVRIGYECYFFADHGAKEEFLAHVTDYCGRLTDPVTGERFSPNASSAVREYEGVDYYFANEGNAAKFEAMPAMYYLPAHAMLPKDSTATETE